MLFYCSYLLLVLFLLGFFLLDAVIFIFNVIVSLFLCCHLCCRCCFIAATLLLVPFYCCHPCCRCCFIAATLLLVPIYCCHPCSWCFILPILVYVVFAVNLVHGAFFFPSSFMSFLLSALFMVLYSSHPRLCRFCC